MVFLRCERKQLSIPVVPPGWKWDAQELKSLYGQGKLYVQIGQVCTNDTYTHVNNTRNTEAVQQEKCMSLTTILSPIIASL